MRAAERIAEAMHEAEESYAPSYRARIPWGRVLEKHRRVRILAVKRLLEEGVIRDGARAEPLFESEPATRASDPQTSHKAAKDTAFRARSHRGHLMKLYAEGATATAEEACALIGKPGAWRRVSELLGAGFIAPTGVERKTKSGSLAEVYKVTDMGRKAYEHLLEHGWSK